MPITNNTHDYYGIIGPQYQQYLKIDNLELASPLSFEETLQEIRSLQSLLKPGKKKKKKKKKKTNIIQMLDLISTDHKNNWDDKNKINMEDLLPRTWRFVKHYDPDGQKIFFQQISEIKNGTCAQGRTTRVFQFYQFHLETKDEIYQKCLIKIEHL